MLNMLNHIVLCRNLKSKKMKGRRREQLSLLLTEFVWKDFYRSTKLARLIGSLSF